MFYKYHKLEKKTRDFQLRWLTPFSGENMVLFTNISSTRLGVSLYHLATVETHWRFPELKTQLQPKTTQKNLTKRWCPSQKKGGVHCAGSFLSTWVFFKVFQTKAAAFPSWFFRENPGASLEAPKCCTSRNRRLMTWLGEDVLRWTSHVLCLNVLK